MLYIFPDGLRAVAARDYERPYDDPISVTEGDIVRPVADGTMQTDILGWTWCIAADGRAGWTPDHWCAIAEDGWRLLRDFSAWELSVRTGDALRLILGESGFLLCETADGERGWLPDAAVALRTEDAAARRSFSPGGALAGA